MPHKIYYESVFSFGNKDHKRVRGKKLCPTCGLSETTLSEPFVTFNDRGVRYVQAVTYSTLGER